MVLEKTGWLPSKPLRLCAWHLTMSLILAPGARIMSIRWSDRAWPNSCAKRLRQDVCTGHPSAVQQVQLTLVMPVENCQKNGSETLSIPMTTRVERCKLRLGRDTRGDAGMGRRSSANPISRSPTSPTTPPPPVLGFARQLKSKRHGRKVLAKLIRHKWLQICPGCGLVLSWQSRSKTMAPQP